MDLDRIKSLLPIGKHLLYTVGLGFLLIIIFFYWFLPFATNHGETITVPDIRNQRFEDLDDILLPRSLKYEVNADSSYNPTLPPLAVIDQFPLPNSRVKENRKLYVTLNARNPPLVEMPAFVDRSLKIVKIVFEAEGLNIGKLEYVKQKGFLTILQATHNGRILQAGDLVPKGALIDLKIADGLGADAFMADTYVNRPLDEAKFVIAGQGLNIGQIIKVTSPYIELPSDSLLNGQSVIEGYVVKQKPAPGDSMKVYDFVDLWVYQITPDTTGVDNSVLDQ